MYRNILTISQAKCGTSVERKFWMKKNEIYSWKKKWVVSRKFRETFLKEFKRIHHENCCKLPEETISCILKRVLCTIFETFLEKCFTYSMEESLLELISYFLYLKAKTSIEYLEDFGPTIISSSWRNEWKNSSRNFYRNLEIWSKRIL